MKCLFDLVLVLGSAPFWLPLLLVLAVLVRVRVGVPVFFLQQRPGLHDVLKGDTSLVGPPSPFDGVFAPLYARAGAAARSDAGHHGLGASKRAQRHFLGREVQVGRLVCGPL